MKMTRISASIVVATIVAAILFSGAAGAAFAGAAAPEETKFPHRAACAVHLLDIGRVLATYALAHDGALPEKLSIPYTVDMSAAGWTNLICPANIPPLVNGGFYPSYVYVVIEGRKAGAEPESIVAFDHAPVHEGGRNVLMGDLENVRYLPEQEFQALLAAQQARAAAEGKKLLLVTDDFIQLTQQEQSVLDRQSSSPVKSVFFKLTLVIVMAIIGTLVLLYLTRRRSAAIDKERSND